MKIRPKGSSIAFRRTVLAVMLGACMGTALAQSTSGDIAGLASASAGQAITIKSLASGVTRQVTVGADGRFRVAQLPIGSYEITTPDGQTRTVAVVAGQTVSADFNSAEASILDPVVV
ncbi:MAG: carboxypeptidase-like regulatory domain-containing protein, partial [Pseudoxanthomonas sp.]